MTRETLKAWPPDSVWCKQADLAKSRWPTSSSPSRGQPRLPWRGRVGDASAMATAPPSGREGMGSPRWEGKQSPGAVLSATRNSSLSKTGMKTVTAKSHCARASGSPRGCAPPSSLPLCGSVMTSQKFVDSRALSNAVTAKLRATPVMLPALSFAGAKALA